MSKLRMYHVTDIGIVFGLAILAYAEYTFGRNVLDLPYLIKNDTVALSLALAVPVFIDSYVLVAFTKQKDVQWAMGLVLTSVVLGMTSHTFELSPRQQLATTVVFGVVVAIVMWRLKRLGNELRTEERAAVLEAEKLRLAAELAKQQAEERKAAAEARAAAAKSQPKVEASPSRPAVTAGPAKLAAVPDGSSKKPAPSRERMRQIVSQLEGQPNWTALAREHGGSPTHWRHVITKETA